MQRNPARTWANAFAVVAAGLVAMLVVGGLGLWQAGAADLPGGAFPAVLAATVVMAVGGSMELTGDAGFAASADASVTAMPLSVSLAGALTMGVLFLRPLRHRAVATGGELLGRIACTAAVWFGALILLVVLARHSFDVPQGELLDDPLGDIAGEVLGGSATIGFRPSVAPSLGFGLLWFLVVLAVAFAVSRKAPLPSRLLHFQQPVRPTAFAVLLVLLGYVAVGLVVGVVVAFTQGHAGETFAVLLLGLPNLVWLAFGLGLGASWEGRVAGPFGLPMPHVLDEVLRVPGDVPATLSVSTLAEHDGRVWWLVVLAAVALLAAGFVMAVRSPAGISPVRHALHLALALAVTMFVICLLTRLDAHVGLSVLGIGDLEGLGGQVSLQPHYLPAVLIGAGWGLAAGFLGSLLALRVRRRGEQPTAAT
ncbi:streptophobe family protein [Streptomyces sp. NPDC051940]|uniref:streptophobe family protein n=1 Tax=Streptomyces sp. NPDC051940 TaxID=3155675 RepID=UPI00343A9E5F